MLQFCHEAVLETCLKMEIQSTMNCHLVQVRLRIIWWINRAKIILWYSIIQETIITMLNWSFTYFWMSFVPVLAPYKTATFYTQPQEIESLKSLQALKTSIWWTNAMKMGTDMMMSDSNKNQRNVTRTIGRKTWWTKITIFKRLSHRWRTIQEKV